jgi:ankyrin repeat protein
MKLESPCPWSHDLAPIGGDNAERLLNQAVQQKDLVEFNRLLSDDSFGSIPESGQIAVLSYAIQQKSPVFALNLLERIVAIGTPLAEHFYLLAVAARAGELDVVKKLIGLGYAVDTRSPKGSTPLCEAAGRGHDNVCAYLLELGVDPNNVSAPDHHPLKSAGSFDSVSTAALLIEAGADPNFIPSEPSEDYLTPFQAAMAQSLRPRIVRFYLERFRCLAHGVTLSGKRIADIADPEARELVSVAITEDEVAQGLGQHVEIQTSFEAPKGSSPL